MTKVFSGALSKWPNGTYHTTTWPVAPLIQIQDNQYRQFFSQDLIWDTWYSVEYGSVNVDFYEIHCQMDTPSSTG